MEKTLEQLKYDEIIRCAQYRNGWRESHESAFLVSFNDFWNNELVTPQEHCDALWNSAYELFQTSALTAEYLTKLNPDFIIPPVPYEYTINQDWTVTIGEKILIATEDTETQVET